MASVCGTCFVIDQYLFVETVALILNLNCISQIERRNKVQILRPQRHDRSWTSNDTDKTIIIIITMIMKTAITNNNEHQMDLMTLNNPFVDKQLSTSCDSVDINKAEPVLL